MKRLLSFMKGYTGYAVLSPIMMILEAATDITVPYLMSLIVDIGIANRDIDYVVKIGILMVLTALIGMVFGILSTHFGARAGFGFASEIRLETFKKIQGFSFANLDKFKVSSLITRLTNDCNTIGQVTMMSLRMGIRAPSMMIFALFMAFSINPSLAIVFGVTIPLTVVVVTLVLIKARPFFLKIQSRVDDLNAIIKEDLAGIRVIKSFNRQAYEESRFRKRNDGLRDTALKAVSIILVLLPFIHLVIYSTIIAVLWFGSKQITVGTLGRGELISFITYVSQISISLMMISLFFMQLLRGLASKDRILAVWDTCSEIKEADNPIMEIPDGSVSFKDVSFRYSGGGENVLKNINLHIESGETIGIIGQTGSSKSTLVQLIPRLYDVSEGSVEVGGTNVKDYNLKVLRDQVAFVLQRSILFSGTIRENMRWGNENATDDEIIIGLKQAQAWDFIERSGAGLEHRVEQDGSNFSGGQKQRLSIARALIKRPKIIILDDSTSAVDITTESRIQRVFREDLDGITTIIISQRISSIQHANRIVVLHQGEIEAIGDHSTLLNISLIYQDIYESQQRAVVGI